MSSEVVAYGNTTFPRSDWEKVFASKLNFESEDVVKGTLEVIDGIANFTVGRLDIMLATSVSAADSALQSVIDSSPDRFFGLDFEWKPDTSPGDDNPIAVVQISSWSKIAVLHVSTFDYELPNVMKNLFGDSENTLLMLGSGSNSGDFIKLDSTFGISSDHITAEVLDVSAIARKCGQKNLGLQNLTQTLLHPSFTKDKKISLSNWEAHPLSYPRILYAALDSVCTEHVYRSMVLINQRFNGDDPIPKAKSLLQNSYQKQHEPKQFSYEDF